MFAQLGNHLFQGLKTPLSWREDHKARYGKTELINGKPVIQHTGDELAEINLSIQYSIDFCDPSTEIESLMNSMRIAEVLPFITGEGSIVGKFVITSVSVSNEMFSPKGRLEIATVDLNLLESAYAAPVVTIGLALASANPTAPSLDSLAAQKPEIAIPGLDQPVIQKPAIAIPSPANAITQDLSKAKSLVNSMKKTISDAKEGIKSYKRAVSDVRKLADAARQTYASAKAKVEATKKIIQRASQLPTSLDGAIKYAENLGSLDSLTDTETLKLHVNTMSDRADTVMSHAAPVAAFAGSKEGGN
jgi:phage protein U